MFGKKCIGNKLFLSRVCKNSFFKLSKGRFKPTLKPFFYIKYRPNTKVFLKLLTSGMKSKFCCS